MIVYRLQITLLSDTTFGRGDGVAGVVDTEVQHDAFGMPYLGGRAVKGLLGAECADIVFSLQRTRPAQVQQWTTAAENLFGRSGGTLAGESIMRVGAAKLPEDLRQAVTRDVRAGTLSRSEILESLTSLRRQTAMDPVSGAPKKDTLRTMRVILRKCVFEASLSFSQDPQLYDLALLAACVKALRRGGTGRNRGRGQVKADLQNSSGQSETDIYFQAFQRAVGL